MIRVQDGALTHYCFEALRDAAVIHGVFTRLGGASAGAFASLNVGHTVGDDPTSVAHNHEAIYRALGTCMEQVVTGKQVHGDRVALVTRAEGGKVLPETDALITDTPGLMLMLRFADCVPVFFYAPRERAVGLAHAGWQGTVKEIAAKTARAMQAAFGCRAEELLVGLGPAIGPCCFEVGPEVLLPLRARYGVDEAIILRPRTGGKAYVDLWQANARQLREVGVQHIEFPGLCTRCHPDEFYSHRGENGHTGRFAALLGLR